MPKITKPGAWPGASANNHAKQIYMPQSCVGYSDKISNLERTIANLEKEFDAALDHARYVGRLNKGLLVASVIKDTCVGFLDVGASVLKMAGMTKAAEVAEKGVAAIDFADTTTNFAMGNINGAQAATSYSHLAAGQMKDDNMTQAATKYVTQTYTGAGKVMANSVGQPKAKAQDAGKGYVKDQIMNTADVIVKGAKESKQPWGDKLGGIMNGVKLMVAADNYGNALEKTFDTYLEEKEYVDSLIRRAEQEFRPKIREMKSQFAKLKMDLQGCINDAQKSSGETPTFELTPGKPPVGPYAAYSWPGAK
ncbi:MAG: hypothetical protein AAFN94_01840 [Pseudomonadota bacterium]